MVLKLFVATICFVGLLEMCEKKLKVFGFLSTWMEKHLGRLLPSHCQLKLRILSTATRASIPGDLVWDVRDVMELLGGWLSHVASFLCAKCVQVSGC